MEKCTLVSCFSTSTDLIALTWFKCVKAEVLRHWYKKNTAVTSLQKLVQTGSGLKCLCQLVFFKVNLKSRLSVRLLSVWWSDTACIVIAWSFHVWLAFFWLYNQLFWPLDWCRVSAVCKGVWQVFCRCCAWSPAQPVVQTCNICSYLLAVLVTSGEFSSLPISFVC